MRAKQRGCDYSKVASANNSNAMPTVCEYDLRGVHCPMSWVKAKLRLEELDRGAHLVLWLDDAKGARDLPRAAEAEGHLVVSAEFVAQVRAWRIVIEK